MKLNNKILLIVEGMDNTGKDTLINNVYDYYKDKKIGYIHFNGPKNKDNKLALIEQYAQFSNNLLHTLNMFNESDIIIWNRSHIGEYVYGQIYRDANKNDILKLINYINDELVKSKVNVIYVQLICSSDNLIINNEDGHSLSTTIKDNDEYLQKINIERELFTEIWNNIEYKFIKRLIKVNDGDKFIDKDLIANTVIKTINDIYEN